MSQTYTQPNQFHPETLIVLANGVLDDSYYDNIYAQKRREAVRQAIEPIMHNVGATMLKGATAALKGLGTFTLDVFEATAEAGKASRV